MKTKKPLLYLRRKFDAFFGRSADSIVPIEVKAGNNQAKSLKTLISGSNYKDSRWGVKFVHGNVGFMNNVLTIPQWCAFLLPRYFGELRNIDGGGNRCA